MNTENKAISIISTLLVFALAAVAFVLSFDALSALAESNGISPELAPLFPLAVDGFILAAALAALRANLRGASAWFPSVLVGAFTVTSIALNVAHSNGILAIPRPWLATVVAAVPPVALFLALELAFVQIRSDVERQVAVDALVDVQAEVDELTEKRQKLLDSNRRARKTATTLAQNIAELRAELDELARAPQSARDALLAFYSDNPLATHEVAGAEIGKSRQWVGPTLAKLEKEGRIKRNGSGVEVVISPANEEYISNHDDESGATPGKETT